MVKQIFLSAIAFALLTGCSGKKEKTGQENEVEVIPVRVTTLKETNISRALDYTASLEAEKQVYYAPAATGRINKIHVEVGDRIREGQLLVEMDRTQLHQAEVQLNNVETEYKRALKLKETGSISEQAFDALVTQYEVAKSNVEFLNENTKLLAPFNGVVTGKFFENGELYTGSPAGGAPKASIISVEKIDPVKALVNMTEQYYPLLKEGVEVELKTTTYPDRTFQGKVSIVYPTIDPASRTFTVEVKIPNNEGLLRPGMYGTINFFVGETNTIVVPGLAVLKLQGSNNRYVFINDNGKAKRVAVTLGQRFDDLVEIFSPEIREGVQLVTTGQARLQDGSPIRITQ